MNHPFDDLQALRPIEGDTPGLPDLERAVVELVDPQAFARRSLERRLPGEAAWYLAAWLEPVRLAPGEALLTYGQPADSLYLLCAGELRARLPLNGDELVLGAVEPGEWLGEVNLLDGGDASATITATAPSLLMRLAHDTLDRICADDPAIASDLLRMLLHDLAARIRRCSAGVITQDEDGHLRVRRSDLSVADLMAGLARGAA